MNSLPSRGFSLIEVIVSVLFLMITIAGLMNTYSYMSSQVERARWKRSALHIAQKKIEEFMADPNKIYSSSETIKDVQVPVTSYSIPSTMEITTDPDDQSIVCTISNTRYKWGDGKEVSVSLRTIVRN